MKLKIGYFGAGNMATAIAQGIYKNFSKGEIQQCFYSPTGVSAKKLAEKVNGQLVSQLEEMPPDLDWYVLAFKPQTLEAFKFPFPLKKETKILSLLAGTSILKIEKQFQTPCLARLMPNTPSRLGYGANLFYTPMKNSEVGLLQVVLEKSLGKLYTVSSEKALDQLTVVSASGPAFIFEYARHFESYVAQINQTEELGMAPDKIKELVANTFLGSAMLLMQSLESGESFLELRDQVASKKGVTAKGLEYLEDHQFKSLLHETFKVAYDRVIELNSNQ